MEKCVFLPLNWIWSRFLDKYDMLGVVGFVNFLALSQEERRKASGNRAFDQGFPKSDQDYQQSRKTRGNRACTS